MNRSRIFTGLILLAVLIAQVLTHLGWLSISAHSGEVALPWMMNQGRVMFGNVLEQHAPGTTVIVALALRLFAAVDPVLVTRMLNLLLVLALTLLIFTLARRLAGNRAGLLAVLIWFWWEPVYGNILFYFDSVVGLLIMLALVCWLLLSARKPGWLAPLAAGFLLGGATLAKQHAWATVVLFGLWLWLYQRDQLIIYIVAALILPLAAVIGVAFQGDLPAYLYWNWQYNLSGYMPNSLPTGDLVRKLVLSNLFLPPFLLLALRRRNRFWLLIGMVWLGALADLLPRFNDIHAMAHLPLACVIGGVILTELLPDPLSLAELRQKLPQIGVAELTLAGIMLMILAGWLWTGAAVYFAAPVGRAGIPAYDEFKPLAAALKTMSKPGDTLFVLPETDSTPQIHPLSGLLAPGTWVKGWFWYFDAPGIVPMLLNEWDQTPPTYIVYFPDLISVGQPGIQPLVDFMNAHYQSVETISPIPLEGDAVIYRYKR
ncbi:MAG TPA: hypothetical protein VHD90_04335 [Phototrophicaceae bacterium]|nr:hypothetical protein [Phototrophicaceae bacterium]